MPVSYNYMNGRAKARGVFKADVVFISYFFSDANNPQKGEKNAKWMRGTIEYRDPIFYPTTKE